MEDELKASLERMTKALCRHVWSLPDENAMVASCLRCGETRGLEELLREGMDSMQEGRGRTNDEVEADFAALRDRVRGMSNMANPQVRCQCGLIPLQGFGTAIKDGIRHTAERCD